MKLHLLEPYRSGMIAQALKERLIVAVPEEAAEKSVAIKAGGRPEIISQVLQLAVLCENTSMVWNEPTEQWKNSGVGVFTASGIENLGVVQFVGDVVSPSVRREAWDDAESVEDIWSIEIEHVDAYKDFILSQLAARGQSIHWSIFRLLRAVRLGQMQAAKVITTSVPRQYQHLAGKILSADPTAIALDMRIMSTLYELKVAFSQAIEGEARLAGAPITSEIPYRPTDLGTSADQVWGIVVDALVGQQLDFPVPQSLGDVAELRHADELRDFRGLLLPFMDSIAQGDTKAADRLRKEIKKAAKAFRRFPVVGKLARYMVYASLTAGIVELVAGFLGPSVATGLVSLGLQKAAERWKKRSSWLYLTRR